MGAGRARGARRRRLGRRRDRLPGRSGARAPGGLLALAALALGFVGFTVARVGGTNRLPGLAAMALAIVIAVILIAAALS